MFMERLPGDRSSYTRDSMNTAAGCIPQARLMFPILTSRNCRMKMVDGCMNTKIRKSPYVLYNMSLNINPGIAWQRLPFPQCTQTMVRFWVNRDKTGLVFDLL